MASIGNIKDFFVTWFDATDSYVTTADITDDIVAASFTDTGSGQVNESVLKLSGAFGRFITNSGGPIISITGGGGLGASGEAKVSGGIITEITVTAGGSGYTSAPTVTITGNGTGATATAVITNEAVTSFTVTAGGTDYSTIPTVIDQYDRFRIQASDLFTATISFAGGGGIDAEAVASTSTSAVITKIDIVKGGSGYTSAPTVTITGNGTGATATATVSEGIITEITVTAGGTGYVGNSYDRFFEFNPLVVPSQTKTEGTLLELNLIGIEYHTQQINFAGRFWFADAFRVAREIGVSYNKNRNSNQPVLDKHATGYIQLTGVGNGFPKFTVNHYEYGLVEDSGYNRWNQMLDKLGGSVADGGILDYLECGFETSAVNAIEIALFSQGSRSVDLSADASLPTIIQSLNINVGSTDVGIAAATATQVAAWGSPTHGSLPTGHSKYASGVDQFIFRPSWDDQIEYLKDSRVKYLKDKHYKANSDITGTPPFTNPGASASWDQIDMSDEFGDTIQYSEWTDDKAREWANCGGTPNGVSAIVGGVVSIRITEPGDDYFPTSLNPIVVTITGGGGSGATATAKSSSGHIFTINITSPGSGYTTTPIVTITGAGGTGATADAVISDIITSETATMFDINIAILDNTKEAKFFRTWVDYRLNDVEGRTLTAFASSYAYGGAIGLFPPGRRALVQSGSVVRTTISDAGAGYTSTPTVSLTGGGGTDAAADAVIQAVVDTVTITAGGTGYTTAPLVVFSEDVDGSGATATATISGGAVTAVTVTNAGTGYTSAPTVLFAGGTGGSGATATSALKSGVVTDIIITNPGKNYTSAPAMGFTGGSPTTTADATAIISNGSSELGTIDSRGIPFANNIIEWDGTEWLVKYKPTDSKVELDNMQVVVWDESTIFQYVAANSTWKVVTGDLAVDCIHKYSTIHSDESYDTKPAETDSDTHPDVTKDGNTFAKSIKSTLVFNYEVGQDYNGRKAAGSATPLGDFFKKGSWAVWRAPFSPNNYGAGVTIGNIYGTDTPAPGEDNLQPAFLDIQNMTWTSRGTRGFNQDESEDLGQLQELVVNITTIDRLVGGIDNLNEPTTVRVWMIDRYDNTVFFDVEIPFLNTSYPVKIPFSSFKIYRGRKPRFFDLGLNNIASLILPQELEIVNRFAFREIQIVGFQNQDFYDEFGRYAPDVVSDLLDGSLDRPLLAKIFGSQLALGIDDFHFTKPILAIARQPGVTRNLESQFLKRPHIVTFKQLLNDAATQLQKEQFQLKEYQIETAGSEIFRLKFGDGFFYENNELVNNQDDTSNPSKKRIKLVVKHIQYNLTSPGTGNGGLTRDLTASKRFE